MKKKLCLFALLVIILNLLLSYNFAFALNIIPDLDAAAKLGGAGYGTVTENTIPTMIGQIVRIVLSFVGAIFFILIVISGIQWMTAGGNEDKVSKSRTRLVNATIGLAITVAAYFITWFISNTLLSA